MKPLVPCLAVVLAGLPSIARADDATLVPPAGFVSVPQADPSMRAWNDGAGPEAAVRQSISLTSHPFAGALADFVKERLVVGTAHLPSLVVVRQRPLTLCGRPGVSLETTYVADGKNYHADTVMALGTKTGYAANYVRAADAPARPAALAALAAFCVKPGP